MMYCLIPVRSFNSLTPPVSAGLIKHRTSVGFKPSCGTGDAGVQHYGPWDSELKMHTFPHCLGTDSSVWSATVLQQAAAAAVCRME